MAQALRSDDLWIRPVTPPRDSNAAPSRQGIPDSEHGRWEMALPRWRFGLVMAEPGLRSPELTGHRERGRPCG
jgi:hypothetical protein